MKIPSLADFLESQGINKETPKEQVQYLKKVYKKTYQQVYYLQRKQQTKRFSLNMTKEEYSRLKTFAKRHQYEHLGKFIKASAFAYLENNYVPRDREGIELLVKQVGKMGNNINQIVQQLHWKMESSRSGEQGQDYQLLQAGYQRLVQEVYELQQVTKNYFSMPPKKLLQALTEFLQDDKQRIKPLLDYLRQLESASK